MNRICSICNEKINEKYHWQKRHQPIKRLEHSIIMTELYKNGTLKAWNKGYKKETHISLKQQSETLSRHWKENPRPGNMTGKKHSLETKLKMSIRRKGEKNGNWKGGLTEKKRGIKRSSKYYQWRMKVLKRDDFTCQKCGQKNSNTAHHIKYFKEFLELRFDINNGLTLCGNCHHTIHFGGKYDSKDTHRMGT